MTVSNASPKRQRAGPSRACISAQKRAILRALRHPPDTESEGDGWPQDKAFDALSKLLEGSVMRNEGNTCLLLGPRGCGKTRMVGKVLDNLSDKPIVLRLSGYAHLSDRAAVREMARQLEDQTGQAIELDEPDEADEDEDEDEDGDEPVATVDDPDAGSAFLPPPSHILSLVNRLPSLARPTIVVIDAIDLFTSHARQALLYCLFDTAQSCRASSGSKGLAIVGLTSRVDMINLLEKRVKSRFSHRIIRISPPQSIESYMGVARAILCSEAEGDVANDWHAQWEESVDEFLSANSVKDALADVHALSQDISLLCRILTPSVLELSPSTPRLTPESLQAAIATQCGPPRFPFLSSLPYPAIGLLIAANHCRSSGHEAFTFEMLHERFDTQIRSSSSAPVQLGGVSIGMLRCSRTVMSASFERLIELQVFQSAAPASNSIAKQYAKYRCVPDRHDIRLAVEGTGQTNLRKWLQKDQT